MNKLLAEAKKKRHYLDPTLVIQSWSDLEPYFVELLDTILDSEDAFNVWLKKRSELESVVEEEKAWRYIKTSCHTGNQEYSDDFNSFSAEIDPEVHKYINKLDKKLVEAREIVDTPPDYNIFIRTIQRQLKLFRDENVELLAELERKEQEYSSITGAMTVSIEGREYTLQQAQTFIESTDREKRKTAFEKIHERRDQDSQQLNQLLNSLIDKRTRVAQNAGYNNYLNYRFDQLNRFDYTLKDCTSFHRAIEQNICPLLDTIYFQRKSKLQYQTLQPYDIQVDPDKKPALKPFSDVEDLLNRSINCFTDIDPSFGDYLSIMKDNGYLDLDSRKGKAPGGYNYPLYESNVPFVFMNASNQLRDVETLMHEGGHAIHSFVSSELPLVYFKELPAEIAELASMSMELISMEHWYHFFDSEDDLKRARRNHLEGVLKTLPWIATIDQFQHWLYQNPEHSLNERTEAWKRIFSKFESSQIDWNQYPSFRDSIWQKQIHIFQFPLYYIEYGIAQLGAIAIWRNYKTDRKKCLQQYKDALTMGYSAPLPELFIKAGIEFDFSENYLKSLAEFVSSELERYY